MIHGAANPLHFVLVYLLYVANTLEDVGDVVYPTFLHSEFLGGLVDVKYEILFAFDEFGESFGEYGEGVFSLGGPFLFILHVSARLLLLLT